MHARVTRVSGPPGQIKEVRGQIEELALPAIRELPGLQHMFFLSDDASGTTYAVAIFATEADLVASREAVQQLRERTVTALGGTVESVDELEVIAQI